MFERGSRYETVADAQHVDASGRVIPYKVLRTPVEAPPQQVHEVAGGDRLDVLAHNYLGDAAEWWRICDANEALSPHDLVAEAGRRITIPLPVA